MYRIYYRCDGEIGNHLCRNSAGISEWETEYSDRCEKLYIDCNAHPTKWLEDATVERLALNKRMLDDLDLTLRTVHTSNAREAREKIAGINRDTDEGFNVIVGIVTALGWVWGGYHWYTTKGERK